MKILSIIILVIGLVIARQLNQCGIRFIKFEEGFRANIYRDSNGHETIGYGHKCSSHNDCRDITPPLNRTQAERILISDLAEAENCVESNLPSVNLNNNQFTALVSLAFNYGCRGFRSLKLFEAIRQGNATAIQIEWSSGWPRIERNRREREKQKYYE